MGKIESVQCSTRDGNNRSEEQVAGTKGYFKNSSLRIFNCFCAQNPVEKTYLGYLIQKQTILRKVVAQLKKILRKSSLLTRSLSMSWKRRQAHKLWRGNIVVQLCLDRDKQSQLSGYKSSRCTVGVMTTWYCKLALSWPERGTRVQVLRKRKTVGEWERQTRRWATSRCLSAARNRAS